MIVRRRGFGWVKDHPDYRDHPLQLALGINQLVPKERDLRGDMPRVRDQGALGSCTAHAGTTVVEYVERYDHDPDHDALSRLWTYYYTRLLEGNKDSDSGATIRNTFKVLATRGAPRERYWPYTIGKFKDEPTAGQRSAPHHRVLEYQSLTDGDEQAMKACLAEGYPFAFGFAVYESFWDITEDGKWDAERGHIDGYHAVVCVGYTENGWIVRNSWGVDFGDNGYFYVPNSFMRDEAWDCWTVRKVTVDP